MFLQMRDSHYANILKITVEEMTATSSEQYIIMSGEMPSCMT